MTAIAGWPELVYAFAGGLLLMGAAALVDRYRHRRTDRALQTELARMLGREDGPMPSLLQAIATAIRDARVQFGYLQEHVSTDEWTLQTWGTRWLELLRDRDARSAWIARTHLETEGDVRDLAQFVRETVRIQKELHLLLFGIQESPTLPWPTRVDELAAAASPVPGSPSDRSAGLLHDLKELRASHDLLTRELQETRATLGRARERLTALSPLLISCGITGDDDNARIVGAADDFGMLLLVARRETAIDSSCGIAALAAGLETRILALRSEATQCMETLAETRRALADTHEAVSECMRSREEAMETWRRYEHVAGVLTTRLELASADRTVAARDFMEHLLHGDSWMLRLLLLATKEAWSSATVTVPAELATFLDTPAVPSHCSAALVALDRLAAIDSRSVRPASVDVVEELCRLFDISSRIGEFRSTYGLQELDAADAWAGVVATAAKSVLARRGVELRRPPLLRAPGTDFETFDVKFLDAQMPSSPAIRERIMGELGRGNDGFVTEVTQSEVLIDGTIRRVGVLSCVSPYRWRT